MRALYLRTPASLIRAGLVGLLAATGCSQSEPSYTQFPVPVDIESTGGVLARVNIEQLDDVYVSIDTMSPLTTIDNAVLGQLPPPIDRHVTTVEILDHLDGRPHARFRDVAMFESHSCLQSRGLVVDEYCSMGTGGRNRTIRGIIGADLLSASAVRFDVGKSEMSFFPDVAGSSAERSALCDLFFDRPFAGGGVLVIGQGNDGTEINFTPSRIAMDVCFFNDACVRSAGENLGEACRERCPVPRPMDTAYGVDGLFVVSTALPVSLVTRTTYDRYVYMHEQRPLGRTPTPYENLPPDTLYLASGPVEVRMARMNHLALVADASDERGPCGERYLNDYLTRYKTCANAEDGACQCPEDQPFCRVAGTAELSLPRSDTVHQGFDVAVVPDDDATLQALRNELRPELPEVSGILGMNVFADLVMDVDYPNDRVLLRCQGGLDDPDCVVRPWVLSSEFLGQTKACLSTDMLFQGTCTALP